jgi:hypothetical protein
MIDLAAFVTANVSPEEWGDAWLCAKKCAASYDPQKGASFKTYWRRKWAFEKMDRVRAERGKQSQIERGSRAHAGRRRLAEAIPLHESLLACPQERRDDDRAGRLLERARGYVRGGLSFDRYGACRCRAAGLSMRQTAAALGVPLPTLEYQMLSMRRDHADLAAPSIAEPVK